MRMLCVGVLLFGVGCAMLIAQNQPPAPFAPQTVKSFADALFADGFFSEAAGEYKRYLFLTDTVDDAGVLPLVSIYNAQKNKDGIVWLKEHFYADVSQPVQEKMNLVKGRLLFLERDAQAFTDFSAEVRGDFLVSSIDFQRIVRISQQLLLRDVAQAQQLAQEAAAENQSFEELVRLSAQVRTKSPALAVFLSALVPGLGKLYGGAPGGFSTDLLGVASFAAGAVYTGIQTDWKNWRPYVFGTAAAVLYIVNLYGSYQNIKRYNEAQYRALYEAADRVYETLY